MVSCSEDVGLAADCGLSWVSLQTIIKTTRNKGSLPPAREDVTTLSLYF
jgi:hypothetical protein